MKNSSWWLLVTILIWTIAMLLNEKSPSWVNILIILSAGVTGGIACLLTENQNDKIKELEKEIKELKGKKE